MVFSETFLPRFFKSFTGSKNGFRRKIKDKER